MHATPTQLIIAFALLCSILFFVLSGFIILVIFKYQNKQNAYAAAISELKSNHENALLQSQIEIQEQTFQNISRDIHDNVGQKLSLAKLLLVNAGNEYNLKKEDVIRIITESINDLRNLSRTLSSERVLSNGFIEALEFEIEQLKKLTTYDIRLNILGEKYFLENGRELILFRIIQESLQNIIKHSEADKIVITVQFLGDRIEVLIHDNGKGIIEPFVIGQGLQNMQARSKNLGGKLNICNNEKAGTTLQINIPINHDATK